MRRLTVFFSLIASILAILAGYKIFAAPLQSAPTSLDQVLIAEIRELRHTLQDFAANGQRVQIAIERVRMQQELVDRIQGEADSIEGQRDVNTSELQQVEESARTLERLLGMENDALHRISLETERKNALQRLEEGKKREQRLRERETQLNASLNTEKAALSELKSKVDEIDRLLENQSTQRRK